MFCYKCGKELPDGAKYCSECGTKFDVEDEGNIDKKFILQDTKDEKKEKTIFRKLISWKVYYPAMVILVGLAILMGKKNTVTVSTIDLYDLVDATEEEVANVFGMDKSELGLYPTDDKITVLCADGKVAMINLSLGDDYEFAGIKTGEKFDDCEEKIGALFSLYEHIEANELPQEMYVYCGKSDTDSLSIVVEEDGRISQIMYMIGLSAQETVGNELQEDIVENGADETNVDEQTESDEIEKTEIAYDNSASYIPSGTYLSSTGTSTMYISEYSSDDFPTNVYHLEIYEGTDCYVDTPIYFDEERNSDWAGDYEILYLFTDDYGYTYYIGCYEYNGEIYIDYNSEDRNVDTYQLTEVLDYSNVS